MSSPRQTKKRTHNSANETLSPRSKLAHQLSYDFILESPPKKAKQAAVAASPNSESENTFTGHFAGLYSSAYAGIKASANEASKAFSSKIVNGIEDELMKSPDIVAHHNTICNILRVFLSENANSTYVKAAIDLKVRHYDEHRANQIETLDKYINCFQNNLSYKHLDSERNNLDSKFREIIDVIIEDIEGGTIPDIGHFIKEKAKYANKQTLNRTPLCISFAVMKNKDNHAVRYMVALSSPEHNEALINQLSKFFDEKCTTSNFQIGEAASDNFNKLLKLTNTALGKLQPRNPDRPCAEKSVLATVMKSHVDDMEDLQNVFNYSLTEDKYELIAPCENCKTNMPGADALLANRNLIISPKKSSSRFFTTNSSPSSATSHIPTPNGVKS